MTHPLVVHSLRKVFPGPPPVAALDNISFHIEEGEIVSLLGPNGAGKTTLIRMVTSLIIPTSGEILFWGKNLLTERSRILEQVGFASTYTSLPIYLTVEENLLAHAALYPLTQNSAKDRIGELLERFEVTHLRFSRFSRLSAGERTRVMLAKAFLPYPKIVVLDEPTASLDPDISIIVRNFLRAQRETEGTTILLSSHNMSEVREVSDRIIALQGGKLIASDSPDALASRYGLSEISWSYPESGPLHSDLRERLPDSIRTENGRYILLVRESEVHDALRTLLNSEVSPIMNVRVSPPTLDQFFLSIARGT